MKLLDNIYHIATLEQHWPHCTNTILTYFKIRQSWALSSKTDSPYWLKNMKSWMFTQGFIELSEKITIIQATYCTSIRTEESINTALISFSKLQFYAYPSVFQIMFFTFLIDELWKQRYIPYARHYNPRFVYFLPHFGRTKTFFMEHFS